jgi:predicted methyltransferase
MLDLLFPYKRWFEIGALVLIFAGCVYGVHTYDKYQQGIGEARIQALWDKEKFESGALTEKRINELQKEKDDALVQQAVQSKALLAFANAASKSSGVFDTTLATNLTAESKASRDALTQYTTTLSAVLSECQRAYTGMAKEADGHASDSLMYQQAWPK